MDGDTSFHLHFHRITYFSAELFSYQSIDISLHYIHVSSILNSSLILYRPDDVVTAVTGLTIEVVHTDAEVLSNNL